MIKSTPSQRLAELITYPFPKSLKPSFPKAEQSNGIYTTRVPIQASRVGIMQHYCHTLCSICFDSARSFCSMSVSAKRILRVGGLRTHAVNTCTYMKMVHGGFVIIIHSKCSSLHMAISSSVFLQHFFKFSSVCLARFCRNSNRECRNGGAASQLIMDNGQMTKRHKTRMDRSLRSFNSTLKAQLDQSSAEPKSSQRKRTKVGSLRGSTTT